ncbi:MAG TPA: NUDIX domain-containing protein [Candidatus Saccharimonadales bacterium]|nr:NUDIX domain-containing protein [Candidatus Saccharimonadales bacterium]
MITKAALLLFREFNGKKQLLFVKTHNRDFYIFPGGVQELNENLESILHREAKDNLDIEIENIQKIGVSTGATPSGVPLEMHLFAATQSQEPTAKNEIEKLWWMSRDEALQNKELLTPIALDEVFPLLEDKKVW